MSSEALYEQYKDALKRGHVAALRGRVEEALLAYAEAARIAPERSTPHSSAGNALLRRKRPAEALRHYDVALTMAPRDEVALLGRAQALAALERRGDAADAFDALAEAQARSGRLADAVDAARRGLEMAEGRERRRTLERLIAQLRATEPDEPGRMALEQALLVLDGPAVPQTKKGHGPGLVGARAHRGAGGPAEGHELAAVDVVETAAAATEATDAEPGVARDLDAEHVGAEAEVTGAGAGAGAGGEGVAAGTDTAGSVAPVPDMAEATHADMAAASEAATAAGPAEPAAEAEVDARDMMEPEAPVADAAKATATPSVRAARVVPAGVTVADLEARAEAELAAGSPRLALEARLDLAALHERDGRIEAALDSCYEALALDPDSVALHLALANLYTQRGWDGLADAKLDLLERIARLDGDEAVTTEIAGLRAGRG